VKRIILNNLEKEESWREKEDGGIKYQFWKKLVINQGDNRRFGFIIDENQ